MSDLTQYDVHGPVAALTTELVMWDAAKKEWQPSRAPRLIRFRPDGQIAQIEQHSEDGSRSRTTYTYNEASQILETKFQTGDGPASKIISAYDGSGRLVRTVNIDEKGISTESEICRYDSSGRKTKIQFVPKQEGNVPHLYAIQGVEASIGGSGAATVTTVYDDRSQPVEVLVHDATHNLLRRMTVTRDSEGRVVKEEVLLGTEPAFPELESRLKDAPPEARESLRAALANAFGPNNALVSSTFTYDQKGRRVGRIHRMGILREERSSFRFDDHDNPVEEIREETGRDLGMDQQGHPRPSNETSHGQHTRFVYKYDAQGNWTEREAWLILEPSPDFQRSYIERRQITYYP